MVYQLPCGKVIYLSLDEYLSMSDEDLFFIVSTSIGFSSKNFSYHSKADTFAKDPDVVINDFDFIPDDDVNRDYKFNDNDTDYFEPF
jgi:hypothetical protein